MKLHTGIDIIEIERVSSAVARYGERFLHRIYTKNELEDTHKNIPSLAARFAAKEAVAKALTSGIGEVGWLDIEVRRTANGQPLLKLYGAAQALASQLGLHEWSLSISHSRDYAVAVVVAIESPDCAETHR